MLKEDACTSESICGGAGKVLERWGCGKLWLGDDIQGSEKTGPVCGLKREEGKAADGGRMAITAPWLLAEVRMEVEVLWLCTWCECHSSLSQGRCPGNGNKLCAGDLQRKTQWWKDGEWDVNCTGLETVSWILSWSENGRSKISWLKNWGM